jgi:hypothetical protein
MNESGRLEEFVYIEHFWPALPKGDSDGALDWFSGMMTLNVPHETWLDLESAPIGLKNKAIATYVHEMFHVFQFSSFGFMHDWAADLFQFVQPVMKRHGPGSGPGDFSGMKRMVDSGSALLTDEEREALRKHFGKLDSPGKSGLTTRSLFEAHAYYCEKLYNFDLKQSSDFMPHLYGTSDPVYRVAFDFLIYVVGPKMAFEWFPSLIAMSLSTADPVDTYEYLAFALLKAETEVKDLSAGIENAHAMIGFLIKALLGTPRTNPWQDGGKRHITFTPISKALQSAEKQGIIDQHAFFACPHTEVQRALENMRIELPIIFRPAPPAKLAFQKPELMDTEQFKVLVSIAAIGQQLTGAISTESERAGSIVLERLSWLTRDHRSVTFALAMADLESGNPGNLVEFWKLAGADTNQKARLWGRIILRLPDEIDPTGDLYLSQHSLGARLIQAIYKELPMAVAYLMNPHGFEDWFGSILSDEFKKTAPEWMRFHPEFKKIRTETIDAIQNAGNSIGCNAWLVHERLFALAFC